jgi:hypothetical protein
MADTMGDNLGDNLNTILGFLVLTNIANLMYTMYIGLTMKKHLLFHVQEPFEPPKYEQEEHETA